MIGLISLPRVDSYWDTETKTSLWRDCEVLVNIEHVTSVSRHNFSDKLTCISFVNGEAVIINMSFKDVETAFRERNWICR